MRTTAEKSCVATPALVVATGKTLFWSFLSRSAPDYRGGGRFVALYVFSCDMFLKKVQIAFRPVRDRTSRPPRGWKVPRPDGATSDYLSIG